MSENYQEIQLQMSDGYRCFGRYWPSDKPIGAVVYLHGIQSHGVWFQQSCRALHRCGFAVLLMDRRGSGRNQAARGDVPNMKTWVADVQASTQFLLRETALAKVHVVGVSWGGKLGLGFYRYCPQLLGSLTLVAPGVFTQIDLSLGKKLAVMAAWMVKPACPFDIPLNKPELFTANPVRQQFIREDQLKLRQVTARFLVCSRRLDWYVRALAARPVVPLTLFLAGRERIINNVETLNFYRRLRTFHKFVHCYDQASHTLEFEQDNSIFIEDLCQCLQRSVDLAS